MKRWKKNDVISKSFTNRILEYSSSGVHRNFQQRGLYFFIIYIYITTNDEYYFFNSNNVSKKNTKPLH